MVDELVLPAIEWDPLSLGFSWSFNLSEANTLGREFHTVELSRDRDWRLTAVASGKWTQGFLMQPAQELRAGQMIAPIPELVAARDDASLVLRDVYLDTATGNPGGLIHQNVHALGGQILFGEMVAAVNAARHCLVWCLNGPRDDFSFTTSTERKRVFRYERKREGFPDRIREIDGEGFSFDSITVPPPACGTSPAVLSAVPKGLPIDDALRPVAIEFYLSTPARVPDWESLKIYLGGLSFVLGRRLVPVGFTLFDESAYQRLHELRSAWAVDLRADCRRPSSPPVPVTEAALGALVPRFVERAAQFGLFEAMWLAWLAESVPLDAALPNLASALESVMKAWFRSTKTKSGGKYMQEAEWKEVSAQAMEALATALKGRPNAERMERRARSANNFGVNEQFEQFFKELALPVGEVEQRAIGARNKAAHGGSFIPAQYQSLGDTVRAYRTLLSRVILMLLEWDGEYIDYSTYGFPSRSLKETLGGPNGDRKAAQL